MVTVAFLPGPYSKYAPAQAFISRPVRRIMRLNLWGRKSLLGSKVASLLPKYLINFVLLSCLSNKNLCLCVMTDDLVYEFEDTHVTGHVLSDEMTVSVHERHQAFADLVPDFPFASVYSSSNDQIWAHQQQFVHTICDKEPTSCPNCLHGKLCGISCLLCFRIPVPQSLNFLYL
jgi:hypothetical protein